MSRCLVIGGNGFIGSHLTDELASRGHEVVVFDRFSADERRYLAPTATRIVGDFLNRADVRSALDGIDLVYHLLSTTTPATAERDPTLDVRTNVLASIALFEAAAEAGVSRVYFGSTGGAIYGEHDVEAMSEDLVARPISPYAIGKLAIEGYLRYFARTTQLPAVSLRISNPYGPRQGRNKRQGVIPIFLNEIAAGRPVTVLGDGSMVRDFIEVADVARMMADMADAQPQHDVYNLGSGSGTTVNEVVAVIREVTGREVAVEHRPKPPTFLDRVVLDTTRFQREFGTPDLTPLSDGISRTWTELTGVVQ